MTTPNGGGPRRIRPGDDLGAVFGTSTSTGDDVEPHTWAGGDGEPPRQPYGQPSQQPVQQQPSPQQPQQQPTQAPAVAAQATPPFPQQAWAHGQHADAQEPASQQFSAQQYPAVFGYASPTPEQAAWQQPGPGAPQSQPLSETGPVPFAPAVPMLGQSSAPQHPGGHAGAPAAAHGYPATGSHTLPQHGVQPQFGAPAPPFASMPQVPNLPPPMPTIPATNAAPPTPRHGTPALDGLGISRALAWAVVLAAAAIVTAFIPAVPLNAVACATLALVGTIVLVVDRFRGPRTARAWLVAVAAFVVLVGSIALCFALAESLSNVAAILFGGS
ncbi:MAG: hypothetical protein ACTH31_15585 [Pseudoclavibacter sp.]